MIDFLSHISTIKEKTVEAQFTKLYEWLKITVNKINHNLELLDAQNATTHGASDWVPIPLADDVTLDLDFCDGLKVRKNADKIEIIGVVKAAWAGSGDKVIAYLPNGYKPRYTQALKVVAGSRYTVGHVSIRNDGQILLQSVMDIRQKKAGSESDKFITSTVSVFLHMSIYD